MVVQPLLDWWDVTASPTKLVILAATLGMVSMLFYGFILLPPLAEITVLQAEVERLEHQIHIQTRFRQQRLRLATEVSLLQERIQLLAEAVGVTISFPLIQADISRAAKHAGVSLMLWKPGVPTDVPGQGTQNGTFSHLEVEGGYHGFARFLDELTRLPKAFLVRNFSINSSAGSQQKQGTILARLDLFAYQPGGMEFIGASP